MQPNKSKYSIKSILISTLKESKGHMLVVVLSLIVLSLAQSLFLLLVGPFLKALFEGGSAAGAMMLSDLVPASMQSKLPSALIGHKIPFDVLAIAIPLLMLATALFKSLSTYFYQLHQQAITLRISKNFRDILFEAIIRMPYRDIAKKSPAHWMSMIMNDVLYLQNSFSDIVSCILKDGILVLSCLIALSVIHLPTTLVLIALAPLLALILGKIGKRIATYARGWQRDLAIIVATVLDIRTRFKFVRAQHGEATELARFEKLNQSYYRFIRRSILLRSSFAPGLEFFGFAVFAFFIYGIGNKTWFGSFSGVDLIQFFAALGVLLRPLRNMGEQLTRLNETQGSLSGSKELFASIQKNDELVSQDAASSDTAPLSDERIVIDHISAGYDDEKMQSADLELAPAKSVAIIGPSGCGKSTLLKTLAGLLKPLEWRCNVAWPKLINSTTLVSQAPFLFEDTIANNILYGISAPVPDEEEIWRKLELVNLARDMKEMPGGLAHHICALEKNLSGGQIQRLVIVRALLRAKKIWLFDEATSAIDPATEEKMVTSLIAEARFSKKIFLFVTHRLSMLAQFDEIWFMENGKITMRGTHQELMQNKRYLTFIAGGLTPSCEEPHHREAKTTL
jgi:subfamily B ATP-binding cassette protein MsbA